jgi:8-oxo-dGTP pyrophosphatase MutT (NUDIX family)
MWVIQSAWWIIYYIDEKKTARFLVIKRHAMSGKIEWVAPKGKIQKSESPSDAAVREVGEETGIHKEHLLVQSKLWATSLRSSGEVKWWMDKDVTYFLMQYTGSLAHVHIEAVEGFLGIHKRATLEEILWLVYYKNMRDIFLHAQAAITQSQ